MNAYNNGYDRLQTRDNRLIACHSVHEKKICNPSPPLKPGLAVGLALAERAVLGVPGAWKIMGSRPPKPRNQKQTLFQSP